MSKFLDELELELVDENEAEGRGTWELKGQFRYYSDIAKSLIVVPAGFVTDFASVPRLPIIFMLVGDRNHKAAVIHDFIYRNGLFTRALCDKIFKEASEVSGIGWWCRTLDYLGVRIGGSSSYKEREA